MSHPSIVKALNEYKRVDVATGIEGASPHRLILMLMDGALSRMNQARIHVLQKNIAERGQLVSSTISIIGGLRDSLDHDAGGEIAANLENLYEYMTRCLMDVNVNNNIEKLDEVISLLTEVRSAWVEIEPQTNPVPETKPVSGQSTHISAAG